MRSFRRETALYLLALLLALAVRLIALGTLPLSDLEAKWALQALGVAQGASPPLGSEPAYILPTAALFFAYGGATNFLARLVPALAGSGLVLAPYLFRERLRPRPALILAFCLALEPGLVAISRQAGTSILALTFALAAWGNWERKQASRAGFFAGMALLSGAALWVGLMAFALAWAIGHFWNRSAPAESAEKPAPQARSEFRTSLWFALGTIVLGGSLLFMAPSGLSAWVAGIPEYLAGWLHPSGLPAGLMLFSLVAYQPLGLILALTASVRGWVQSSTRVMRLSLWMVVALLVAVIYPARQIGDLAWMLVPLWALASLELARSLNVRPAERRDVLGVMAVTFLILAFTWLNFLALLQASPAPGEASLRGFLMLGSFFLLAMTVLLVGIGWSARVARFGAVWGIVAAFSLYTLSVLMSAAGLRAVPDSADLWGPGGHLPQAKLLLASINDMSDWSDHDVHAQPVTIVGIDSPALVWLVHERTVQVQDTLEAAASQPMLITVSQDNPSLDAAYRGESFVWRRTPLWAQTALPDWVRWVPFHQIPQQSEMVILWVRSDLFIDSTAPKP